MLTPGGGRVGSVMSGSLDDRLAGLAGREGRDRIADLHVGEMDALVAGLSSGGDARCLLVPATELPAGLWGASSTASPSASWPASMPAMSPRSRCTTPASSAGTPRR